MKLTELFLAELEREAVNNRRVLERVPTDRPDWKPHEKSMPLGYLAYLVATMPSWVAMIVDSDEFDMRPGGVAPARPPQPASTAELLGVLDESVAKGREGLSRTTDEHLMKNWRLLIAGRVVDDRPRHIVIRDAMFAHLAHHRGQLTVYLRLNEKPVPAIYGPSADEGI
jgi:uncharacterized damage-inducible protein DinB